MSETSFPDLRAFLDELRRERDLVVVESEVDARLEAAEIHRRVIAAGGPALLFTRVRGAEVPLVTNLFGTARRAELAFGRRPARLVRRLVQLAQTLVPPTAGKLWGARDVVLEAMRIGLSRRASGPVTEIVTDDVRLDRLPALTCWPEDGGPFVTLPLVYTEHPDGAGTDRSDLRARARRRSAARLRRGALQPRHVPYARARRAHDGHALADRQGGRLPPRRGRGAWREPAGHRLPRRPARTRPRRDRAAARERARADARVAPCRASARPLSRPRRAPPRRERRAGARRPRAAARAPARGPVRRPLRLLLAAPRLPRLPRRPRVPATRRDLPGHGRRQAEAGGLLHRRPPAGAARLRSSRSSCRVSSTCGRTARRAITPSRRRS